MTLAASSPVAEPIRRVEQPSSGTSSASTSTSMRHPSPTEQLERAVEAVVVVDERARDTSSFSRMRLGSIFGPLDTRADEHQRTAALQLREPGFHGVAVARALEHDVERLVDEVVRHRRHRRVPRA